MDVWKARALVERAVKLRNPFAGTHGGKQSGTRTTVRDRDGRRVTRTVTTYDALW